MNGHAQERPIIIQYPELNPDRDQTVHSRSLETGCLPRESRLHRTRRHRRYRV